MKIAQAICSLLTVVLVGCGGGGGGGGGGSAPAPTPVTTAEGFWVGTTSTGYKANLAILENGETWGVYASGGVIYGALYGTTNSSGTTLNGSGSDFNIPSRTVTAGTYSGTFSSKSNINVTTSQGGQFSGTYDASYEQPASLTTLAGSFSGGSVTGYTSPQTITVGISSQGVLSAFSGGCSISGTAAPRASGKNVFNVAVNFVGTCVLGNNSSAAGVAYYDATNRMLLVMGLKSDKSDGFIFVGSKL